MQSGKQSQLQLGVEVREFSRSFLNEYRDLRGAFGDPDGRRANTSSYIDVDQLRRSSFYSPDEDAIRVVVGRKGSGKTLFLRRIRELVESGHRHGDSDSYLIFEAEQTQLKRTGQIVAVSRLYPESQLTETWQHLWGRAILQSLLSHIALSPNFHRFFPEEEIQRLERDFPEQWADIGVEPRTPFSTLKKLIGDMSNEEPSAAALRLNRLMDDPVWDDLETRLARLIRSAPEIYCFIDAIDEEFTHAPMEWMRCQKGLFYEVMRLLRHRELGGSLHIVISIRDLVLHSVFRSEHSPRYMGDSRIRLLEWDAESASAFLDRKVRNLSRPNWGTQRRPRDFADWIGISEIDGESIYEYVARYTQCLPREMVLLGNLVSQQVQAGEVIEEGLRRAVRVISRVSALTQLEVSANQIRADSATRFVERAEHYSGNQEYTDRRARELLTTISPYVRRRISAGALSELRDRAIMELEAPDLPSVLWQNGLLGYVESDGSEVFFAFDVRGRFVIPNSSEYCFHPSLCEL